MVNIVPPAPPPYQPSGPGNNPYDFITNPGTPSKGSRLGGKSKNQRIMLAAIFGGVLLFVIIIVAVLLSGSSSGLKTDYTSLVQQQAELIRVSEIGEKQSRDTVAKNMAITTRLSLLSSQGDLHSLAKKNGASTDTKTLALGKNSKTDAALAQAEQTNQFDQTFISTMEELLTKYRQTLRKIIGQTTSTSARKTLQQADDSAKLLSTTKEE